jgi:hypothetical protein
LADERNGKESLLLFVFNDQGLRSANERGVFQELILREERNGDLLRLPYIYDARLVTTHFNPLFNWYKLWGRVFCEKVRIKSIPENRIRRRSDE